MSYLTIFLFVLYVLAMAWGIYRIWTTGLWGDKK
jgi:hypothetical protein